MSKINKIPLARLEARVSWSCLVVISFVFSTGITRANTFIVPDGDVTALIAALAEAEDGDLIRLAENGDYLLSATHNVKNGANGLPVISHEITVEGNGATIERDHTAPPFRILYLEGVGSQAVFSGLTLRGGKASDSNPGGGMYAEQSSPHIIDCLFEDNFAEWGGGLYNDGGSASITNSVFRGNHAGMDGGGAGMANVNNATPTITGSLFESNEVFGARGGGLFNDSSSPIVINSTFRGNGADYGGGMGNWNNSHPTVTECLFEENVGDEGGGGMANVDSHPAVTESIFRKNLGHGHGGGIYNARSSPVIADCTFEENGGDEGAGIANLNNSHPSVTNSLFLANSGSAGAGLFNQGSSPVISHSVFIDNLAGLEGGGMANLDNSQPAITDSAFRRNSATDGGGIFSAANSSIGVESTSFCENDPEPIAGPWQDLGDNEFSDLCADTYDGWVRNHFDESDWEDPLTAGFKANPAGDRIPNLLKYALGLDPWKAYSSALPLPEVRAHPETGPETYLTITVTHPSGLDDVEYEVHISNDLVAWPDSALLVSSERAGVMTTRVYRDLLPADSSERRFMRLQVSHLE